MERTKIQALITKFDDLSKNYSNEELYVAMYIYCRYGIRTFKYYIDETDIEAINKLITGKSTLFDEDLNYKIDKIINADE